MSPTTSTRRRGRGSATSSGARRASSPRPSVSTWRSAPRGSPPSIPGMSSPTSCSPAAARSATPPCSPSASSSAGYARPNSRVTPSSHRSRSPRRCSTRSLPGCSPTIRPGGARTTSTIPNGSLATSRSCSSPCASFAATRAGCACRRSPAATRRTSSTLRPICSTLGGFAVTISIFPDVAGALDRLPASDTTGPPGRWVLHRAGILNVWQYDRVELRFAGGRLLLRGKNGAGKSKALEIILPFLFDGDTRRLDATGRDRTSVRWLMSDGRPAGNHVGYVWLELRCADGEGEQFHTLGAGLKASTRHRAYRRLVLQHGATSRHRPCARSGGRVPVDRQTQGGDRRGGGHVVGREHRRRVGRHLFGLFDEARFDNLLHLMHRLRDPNIGNRVEAGELAHVLSDALPPIDERVLSDAAGRFDDLESIREQVDARRPHGRRAQPVPRRVPGLCPHRAQPPGGRRRRGRAPSGRRRTRPEPRRARRRHGRRGCRAAHRRPRCAEARASRR